MIADKRRIYATNDVSPRMRKSLGTARSAALEFISDLSKTSLKAARTSPLRATKDCEGG